MTNNSTELTLTIDSKNFTELQAIANAQEISLAEVFRRALALYKLVSNSEQDLALVDRLENTTIIRL